MDNNFYERVKARLIASQEGHLEKVVASATDSETRRKAKQAAKARRRHARRTPEEKKALSQHKTARAKELHGQDFFVNLGRAFRDTAEGIRAVREYNHSDSHRRANHEYLQRLKEQDPEGYALKQRERKRQERIRAKSRGLWFMLTSLPDNYFEALLSRPPAPGV